MDKPESLKKKLIDLKPNAWDWATLLLPILALAPQLHLQSLFLWERQHLQFYPMAFGAAFWFLYNEGDHRSTASATRRLIGTLGSVFAILMAIASILFASAWLSHATLIAIVWSWAIGRLPNLTLLRITGICGLMLVTLPAPNGLDGSLISALQSLSSQICSHLMDVTNIIHVRRGNVLEIAAKTLFVEEACSGVDSQYALMAVAGVLLLIGRASLIVSLLTIVTVPIWAILGNLLRIYTIVIGLEFLAIDLSAGFVHTLLGLFVFVIAAWAHWSSVQFLNFLELRYFEGPALVTAKVEGISPTFKRNAFPYGPMALSCIATLLSPLPWYALYSYYNKPVPRISKSIADRFPGKEDLPQQILGQFQTNFYTQERETRNILGQHSHVWMYSGKHGKQVASLDMPFRGWHPLWECYMKSGWQRLESIEVNEADSGSPLPYGFYESVLKNGEGDFAVLHFSLMDEDGMPFDYDGSFENTNIQNSRWENTIFSIYKRDDRLREKVTFQFQLLTPMNESPTSSERQYLRKIFLGLRDRLDAKSRDVILSIKAK